MPPKAKVAQTAEKSGDTITINKAEFIRTRDAVVTSWMQLNGAIEGAIKSYITHSNAVLAGDEPITHDSFNVLNSLMVPAQLAHDRAVSVKPEDSTDVKEKKKRNVKPKDPNAPKRPVTAYLLYLEDKRPEIQNDLGEGQKRGDISAEGTRRWHALTPEQQQVYKDRYRASYNKFLLEAEQYKLAGGQLEHEDSTDSPHPDAPVLESTETAEPGVAATDASSEVSDDSDDEAAPAKEPTPPPPPASKTPKGKGRKAKVADDAAPASSPIKSNKKPKQDAAFTAVNGGKESPSLKRKADAKAEPPTESAAPKAKKTKKDAAASKAAAPAVAETPKKDKKERKKRKSEA